jgi:serine/threonine-protein kinase
MRAPLPAIAPRRGAVVANKYRVDRLIARGGMGAVWEAWDTSLERKVALKFMDPEIAARPVLRARFNREAKAAARLRTPHVVQIIEHGVDDDTPFIVMELLEGEDLQRRLKRDKRLALSDLAPIVRQISKGLKAAHEGGIIHRDLKPQNVFLAQQDGDLCVKILDFGVAKVADMPSPAGEGTKTGVIVGSPHYMSPEQARGLPGFDHRSDLWSLGVIVFKALTGHRPFKGEVAGDVIVKICADPIPRASETARGIPRLLDRFFDRALERDPNARFQSATELADVFDDYVDEILEDDQMKTVRWEIRKEADSRTALVPLMTPPTTVVAREPLPAAPEEPDKPGVVVAADPAAPSPMAPAQDQPAAQPEPMAKAEPEAEADGEAGSVESQADPLESSQNAEVMTPVTGSTSVSGFAGTVPTDEDLLWASTQRTRRLAVVSGVSAGSLLLIAVLAMALTTAPRLKSELSVSAEAAAPDARRPAAASSDGLDAGDDDESGSQEPARDSVQDRREGATPPPGASSEAASSATETEEAAPSASAAEEPSPPPRPRPRPRPRNTADWGY